MNTRIRRFAAAICLVFAWPALADLTLADDAKSLALSEALAIDGVSSWARRPINVDGVVAAMVDGVLGDPARNPKAGDTLAVPPALEKEGGPTTAAWKQVGGEVKGEGMQASGVFGEMPRGTYLLFAVHSGRERVMMLEASGHGVAYVNGEPRVGDPYSFGFVRLPILLHEGANQIILQHANRGEVRARLEEPRGRVEINESDLTLPDVIAHGEYDLAVPLANCTTGHLHVLLRASERMPDRKEWRAAVSLPPMSVTKVPVRVSLLCQPAMPSRASVSVDIAHANGSYERLAACDATFTVRDGALTHKRTYTSVIDGSVQYVSVVPPLVEAESDKAVPPGLVLSLHGASVEATNQAASYAPKRGLVIACPTNRRPYGFDWEDWGRIDALESMDFVAREFKTDPRRQYLTGHSMGGHGTWQLGCLYPERFAAIAPSAGWLSFATYMSAVGQEYGPAGDDAVMRKFREVVVPSNTLALLPNLQRAKGTPASIYILHGDADDNVPVSEARHAREELTKLGIPFEFHEQPGAGHWWDDDAVKKANAGAGGETTWGTACVDWPAMFEMFSARTGANWPPDEDSRPFSWIGPDHFHPGSFKRVFNNRFVLVYGTHGTPEENAWAYAKARFDGEQWWYRGNGYARVVSDEVFGDGIERNNLGANAVLYGDRRMNRAWKHLDLGFGEPWRPGTEEGDSDLGGERSWVSLRAASPGGRMLIGSVGGSTIRAMRATDRFSYFSAGVDYPSVTLLSPDIWTTGEAGVRAAGFVGSDGQVKADALAWRPDQK
jgi:dienelactone hydrolase